jgi:hypothetical protein
MGQVINVTKITVSGDAAVFDSDRSLSGQDGSGYSSAPDAAEDPTFPARLAAAIFAADPGIAHVHVASNGVVVKREDGWDDSATAATAGVIREFFVFYRD